MKRFLPLALAALCGCAGLKPGLGDKGLVLVEPIEGRPIPLAERDAVARALPLFLSSATASAKADFVQKEVLGHSDRYVAKRKEKGESVLVLVNLAKLAVELDKLGLVRPEGVSGSPKLLVSLRETGPGAGREVGRASESLRRELIARGYSVIDLSDRLDQERQKTGTPEEAKAVGRKLGATAVVTGRAEAQAAPDERLEGYKPFRARVAAEVSWGATGEDFASAEVEASAVDLSAESAAAKALENAGALAAHRLAAQFAAHFRQREEVSATVYGLGPWERVLAFLEAVRSVEGVAAAAVGGLRPGEARLRVFVERMSADELVAKLLQLKTYELQPRWVEPDARYVELEAGARD